MPVVVARRGGGAEREERENPKQGFALSLQSLTKGLDLTNREIMT